MKDIHFGLLNYSLNPTTLQLFAQQIEDSMMQNMSLQPETNSSKFEIIDKILELIMDSLGSFKNKKVSA